METIMDGKLTANQTEERFHITLQKGKTVLITGNCYDSLVNSQEIITPMKVRKLLITGGCYDTEMYRNVKRLREKRMSVEQIGERLKKRPETIRSYLPYERVIYNLMERSVNADRLQRFKKKWGQL